MSFPVNTKWCPESDKVRLLSSDPDKSIQEASNFPDYQLQKGRLYRYILHNVDFREVDLNEQWK